jgi:hypothetical protein
MDGGSDLNLIYLDTSAAELRELSLWLPTAPLSPVMPPTSSAFMVDEDAKAAQIITGDPAKAKQIRASLDLK